MHQQALSTTVTFSGSHHGLDQDLELSENWDGPEKIDEKT